MDKRFLLFLLISLWAVMLYVQLTMQPPAPDEGQAGGSPAAAVEPTPGEAPLATSSPGVASASAQSQIPSDAEDHVLVDPATISVDPVVIETEVYRIVFDRVGAQPREWEIIDSAYSHVGDEADELTVAPAEQIGAPEIITRVPPGTGIQRREKPLGLELPEPYGDDFNRLIWNLAEPPSETDDALRVAFESPPHNGLVARKEFVFHRGAGDAEGVEVDQWANGYLSEFTLTLHNIGSEKLVLSDQGVGYRLTWGPGIGTYELIGFYNLRAPLALVDDDTWYKTPSFKAVDRPNTVRIAATNPEGIDWAGLQSRYFLAAIVPAGESRRPVTRVAAEIRPENAPIDERTGQLADRWKKHTSLMTVGLESGQVTLDPGQIYTATYNLFVGPKHRPLLLAAGNQLERADYYSSWFWMRGLCIVLTKMLNVFHAVVGNYGWAILLLTVVIRLMLYPLTHRQMVIMAKTQQEMARVKPFIDEVKEKYKDEPQRMQREMMAVYKEHGVNPFAGLKGCLPLVFQMPIFIALFIVLRSSIELRGAQWLWIKDLSGPDALFPIPGLEELPLVGTFLGNSFNLLPILMAVTQWLTMKLSPTRIDDPAQRTMMSLMPIGLSVFMYRAPSGLMIYWIAGNLWQMGHQHLTTKWVQHHTEEKPASESPEPPKADHKSKHGKMAKGESATSRAKAKLAERRRDATKARQRAVSESSSLPRWVRRGGG